MALKIGNNPTSFTNLLKDGYKHFEEAIYRNINACEDLCRITRSSLGPHGMKKMIVNELDKLFVTSDAATILRELQVVHPAAKLLAMAAQQQEQECGDATNLTLIFAGELLHKGEELLKMGMHVSDIVEGYERALDKLLPYLEKLVIDPSPLPNIWNEESLMGPIQTALATKQYGFETFLARLVCQAALTIMPSNASNENVKKPFLVDSIRIVKLVGGSLLDSSVVPGMLFPRAPESRITSVKKAKVAVYACPVDIGRTETKGTVLLHDAKELMAFSAGEEELLREQIQAIADTGVKVVVTGGTFGDLALHFLNQHDILAIKIPSKFDLQRLCRVVGATASARLGPLSNEEMGYCDVVECVEIGADRVTIFRQEESQAVSINDSHLSVKPRTATIVLRGSTSHFLDDVERALDDGIQVVKTLSKDARLVPGAGATEFQLSIMLTQEARQTSGLAQYAMLKFAETLEIVPRVLASNAGLDPDLVLSKLNAQNVTPSAQGTTLAAAHALGVDIESLDATLINTLESKILDSYISKRTALQLATDAALSVLRIDSIIMSKQAGGPKPQSKPMDDD